MIDVETPLPCGIVTLPAQTPDWPCAPEDLPLREPLAHPPEKAVHVPAALRVLLVEDDPGDAHLVKRALTRMIKPRFIVTHVETLESGLHALSQGDGFDVVLLDLSLPDSFGMHTLMSMQQAAPRLPIVIMTGHDDPKFAEGMLEAGAQDYLVKSGDPGSMVARAIRYAITRMAAQIERSLLTEQVMDHQRSLMQELTLARSMQFDLLPSPAKMNPMLTRLGIGVEADFEPSSSIGGDLWGCIDCGGDKVAFYTFDFSGHGVGAALNVFRLHALISNHWQQAGDPGQFLASLNVLLNGLLRRGQFATMFVGVLDCAADEMIWASAGAPCPLQVKDGIPAYLEAKGMPLGLVASSSYRTQRTPLPVGASIFLYSDALTEAELPDGKMLGEEGLLALAEDVLGGEAVLRVGRLMAAFRARVVLPLQDDLTAVCITRLRAVGEEG